MLVCLWFALKSFIQRIEIYIGADYVCYGRGEPWNLFFCILKQCLFWNNVNPLFFVFNWCYPYSLHVPHRPSSAIQMFNYFFFFSLYFDVFHCLFWNDCLFLVSTFVKQNKLNCEYLEKIKFFLYGDTF